MRGESLPEGFHMVMSYLLVDSVRSLIEFLSSAFNAEEIEISTHEDGTINHPQLLIGDSIVTMGQSQEDYPPMPTMLFLYVNDVDTVYSQALEAGGESLREPGEETDGDRTAAIRDKFGNRWRIAMPLQKE